MVKFIGLDGAQGSGKTTYARKLLETLQTESKHPVLYIETDDYLTEREWREPLPEAFFREFENRRKLWDFTRMGRVLNELKEADGQTVVVEGLYNRQTGKRDRTERYKIYTDSVILVGGPFLLGSDLEGLFSRLILLDVPEDVRRNRIVGRNVQDGKSKERALEVFKKFEHFYKVYWKSGTHAYDEVISN